jgi:hypothetical protein
MTPSIMTQYSGLRWDQHNDTQHMTLSIVGSDVTSITTISIITLRRKILSIVGLVVTSIVKLSLTGLIGTLTILC